MQATDKDALIEAIKELQALIEDIEKRLMKQEQRTKAPEPSYNDSNDHA